MHPAFTKFRRDVVAELLYARKSKLTGHHICNINLINIAILRLENKMKKMAEETSESLKQIHDIIFSCYG